MAIIYSYPLTTPKVKDLLIGTSVFDEDDENSPRNNPTVSFTIQSLVDMIAPGVGGQTLQQVTNLGASTTNAITIANGLSVTGTFTDSTGGVGIAGQVLSSTNIGTAWVSDAGGTVKSVAATHAGNAFSASIGNVATVNPSVNITMNGITAQYVNGAGNLATLLDIPGLITSLTTNGTSGVSTLVGRVLNIPNYANTQNTLTTTGTGVATLVGTVLNIPTPVIPFTSLTTTGSGVATLTTGVLNIPDYTYTEIDTLATVTARGASTAVASTFSGGLNSSGILTCNGTGANAYSYFTGNGGGAIPPSSFTHGMTQVWNNSAGSREWETFWATGADIEGDPAVPADGHAANASSYMSGYNRYAGASTSGTPVDTRMYKWYGNGELEILDMATLPGGNARPTVSTPYITLPLSAGTNNSMLVRKSTKEVEFSASLSYNESNATLGILPASGTVSEIQMKSADGSIWKLTITNFGGLDINGPF